MSEQECRNDVSFGGIEGGGVRCNNTQRNAPILDCLIIAVESTNDEQLVPVSDNVAVGKALREMRLSLCQTQGFMAELFGIPVSKWSAIENARK